MSRYIALHMGGIVLLIVVLIVLFAAFRRDGLGGHEGHHGGFGPGWGGIGSCFPAATTPVLETDGIIITTEG